MLYYANLQELSFSSYQDIFPSESPVVRLAILLETQIEHDILVNQHPARSVTTINFPISVFVSRPR